MIFQLYCPMNDYKMEAAKAALQFIKPGQTIGLGAGATIANLAGLIAAERDHAASLTFTSSSFKTASFLNEKGLTVKPPSLLKHLDIYFDGCDQFDTELNALKSGGGIHTTEKILASMADEFILAGDAAKFATKLDITYPLVIEVIPAALQIVLQTLVNDFPGVKLNVRMSNQKDGAVISDNGNMLVDVHFTQLKALDELNIQIKMIPGVIEHSLFYHMATKAIIAGEKGVSIITPSYLL
jgi:ribose 5-phosphate isomerase A